VKWCSHGDNCK